MGSGAYTILSLLRPPLNSTYWFVLKIFPEIFCDTHNTTSTYSLLVLDAFSKIRLFICISFHCFINQNTAETRFCDIYSMNLIMRKSGARTNKSPHQNVSRTRDKLDNNNGNRKSYAETAMIKRKEFVGE